jgi:hypothetical protein
MMALSRPLQVGSPKMSPFLRAHTKEKHLRMKQLLVVGENNVFSTNMKTKTAIQKRAYLVMVANA